MSIPLQKSDLLKYVENENKLNYFLEIGGNVNIADTENNTLLHLVIAAAEEDVSHVNRMVELLIRFGANLNSENDLGQTPLFLAIAQRKSFIVKRLLEFNANLQFKTQNALHLAAEIGDTTIIKLILEDQRCNQGLINGLDFEGLSPLYRAARFANKDCLKALVLKGGDLSFSIKNQRNLMDIIFDELARPEEFLVELLNEGIFCEVHDQKHKYVVDLKILAPHTCAIQTQVLVDFIGSANQDEENVVLQHPLIEFLLILKWSKMCQFYYYLVVLYGIYALSLSVYGISLSKMLGGHCKDCNSEIFYRTIFVSRVGLIFSGVLIFLHVGLQAIVNFKKFLKVENIFTLLSLFSSLFVSIYGENYSMLTTSEAPDWILQIISVLLLYVWMELMSLLGRLPALGYYAIMFTTVLKNVIKVLSIFICLLLGFALSFSIQFHSSDQFTDPFKALVKTTVMMTGEFEYTDLFSGESSNETQNYSFYLSRFLFLMFIILNSIVLMNLMIALAASDIQALAIESHARKAKKMAYFIYHMEKVLCTKWFMIKWLPKFYTNYLESKRQIRTYYEFSRTMRNSKNLPTRLIEHIKTIGKEHKKIIE